MKLKKILCAALTAALLTQLPLLNAGAATETCTHNGVTYCTFNHHILSGGVGQYGKYRRYYWVRNSTADDKSVISFFRKGGTDNIAAAFNKWVNTSPGYPNVTTSISFRETTTQKDAMVEIQGFNNWMYQGHTEFKKYERKIEPQNENWGWAIIQINPDSADVLSERAETGLIAHELGHAMGLSHQYSTSMANKSIMYPTNNVRKMEDGKTDRDGPASADCKTINHLYN